MAAIKGASWTLVCPHCQARLEISWLGAVLFVLALSWVFFHYFFITDWMYENLPTEGSDIGWVGLQQPHHLFIWVALLILPPGFIFAAMFRFGYRLKHAGHNPSLQRTRQTTARR